MNTPVSYCLVVFCGNPALFLRTACCVATALYYRWNCDFSKVGRCPLRRINELEVAVLQVLQYNVRVASSLFAR